MADRPSKLSIAWTAGRLAGRRLLGREAGARDEQLGELLTAQLDQMKGLAMKVGQIVSYMDVPLPDAVQERLARLQQGERGMEPAQAREVIESALGAQVEALFDGFDWDPVAAASIGQVHRARLEGRQCAVKVRYPSVSSTMSEDLSSLRHVARLASLGSAVDGTTIVEELRQRLVEECDYGREARYQQAFARAFSDDPEVWVPEVFPRRSAESVLTSEWVEGEGFAELRQHASALPERRDAIAATLVRFTYTSLLKLAVIQADPHPGNYVFPPSAPGVLPGTVAFLDFGCVRTIDRDTVLCLRSLIAALRDRDHAAFRQAVDGLGMAGKPERFDYAHHFRVMEHLHRPLLAERFAFSLSFVREAIALNGPTSPNARTMSLPPVFVWIMRLQWGLWSILARLGATGSFAELTEELLRSPLTPLEVERTKPEPTG